MKLFRLILLFMIVGIVFQQSGCDTTPIDPHPGYTDTLFQSQDFLDYWYFNEGSWWVYKRTDTSADVFDTAIVTKTSKKYIFSKYYFPYCVEKYYMHVFHTSVDIVSDGLNIIYESYSENRLDVNNGGGEFGYFHIFWWPIEFDTIGYTAQLDSIAIKVNQQHFKHCVHIKQYMGEFWLSRFHGLIKIQHNDGNSWELVDYYLKQ
jgi:hypothetical protein